MQEMMRRTSFFISSLHSSLNGIYTLFPKGGKKVSFSRTEVLDPRIIRQSSGSRGFSKQYFKSSSALTDSLLKTKESRRLCAAVESKLHNHTLPLDFLFALCSYKMAA